jgi:Kef-type K+ transport system membrane component KefB
MAATQVKLTAAVLWLACVLAFVFQHDTIVGRVVGVLFGLCALGATMNVLSNRNDH